MAGKNTVMCKKCCPECGKGLAGLCRQCCPEKNQCTKACEKCCGLCTTHKPEGKANDCKCDKSGKCVCHTK